MRPRRAESLCGGGNIIDFLALAGVDTAKAVCAVRDEFRRTGSELPRLAFADILVPHQGPAAQAAEVALASLPHTTAQSVAAPGPCGHDPTPGPCRNIVGNEPSIRPRSNRAPGP